MSNIFKTFQDLLDYIDDNYVTDEETDDDGSINMWRSERFGYLIDKAREELGKLAQLPYPPSAETVAPLIEGVDENGRAFIAMSSVSYPTLDENGISYISRIRLNAVAKLRKELIEAD